jgi:hypothetical protein
MDKPALFALATATIAQCLPKSVDRDDNMNLETGGVYPHDAAAAAVTLWERYDEIERIKKPINIFKWGFEFGLQLGAAIATNPGHIPDINNLTKEITGEIEELLWEQLKNGGNAA